nr:retrotransposon Gag domain, retroviral aspartyl protease [Tanacetum cinerariifolium]
MVQTRNSENNNPPDPIATQLAAIAAKLEVFEMMKEDIAALKEGERSRSRSSRNGECESSWRGRQPQRPHNKIDFPIFSSGDPRGWLMKAENTSEFQNPDEFLCSIKQTGSVQEYRQEFAKRSSRVSNWPDHCLLGVFINGLKDELKSDVRIHMPRTIYSAMSLALEFESKLTNHQPGKNASCTTNSKPSEPDSKPTTFTPAQTSQPKNTFRTFETEKQNRFLKGECFICDDKYEPGHLCKTGTLKGKPHPTTMKVHGMLHSTEVLILIDAGSTHNFISDVLVNKLKPTTQPLAPFGVQIGNGDVIRCGQICKNLPVQINDLKITQDFHPFSLGGADLVLGIQEFSCSNFFSNEMKVNFNMFRASMKNRIC